MKSTRRDFIKNTSLVSLGFVGLSHFTAQAVADKFIAKSAPSIGFGPLIRKPGEILNLPKGFSYKVISRKGDVMNDGLLSPGVHDGMGTFHYKNGKVMLIRNHEISPGANESGPFGAENEMLDRIDRDKIYDFGNGNKACLGGTTTLIVDEKTQKVELEYLSLTGTIRNCAGGATPWNSWITCEETEYNKGDFEGALEKNHGYNFEVPANDKMILVKPRPLKAMGRFVHEAVAVHPTKGIVYQTEDSPTGAFYRFIPNEFGKLHKGGKLQCLALKEWKSADTRNWENLKTERFPKNKSLEVEWIDLEDVEARETGLSLQAYNKGGARFANAEGIWFGKGELYFACTSGGENAKGQIFRYVPSEYEGTDREGEAPGKLELFLEPNNTEIVESCDNLTIAPWGDVIICEDKADARILGITPKGEVYIIAQNIGYRKSEFAGPVFSPSGKTLFINIQYPGLTLAITGSWLT